jgi:cytidine deaminase
MRNKTISVTYSEYSNIDELAEDKKRVCLEAVKETENSYAPYSGFNVGAAVLLEDGTIYSANNQENAAFPSGLCAERVAIFYAMAKNPGKRVVSIAIAAAVNGKICPDPVYPCGACRQVIAEYRHKGEKKLEIISVGSQRVEVFEDIENLLPFTFSDIPSGR